MKKYSLIIQKRNSPPKLSHSYNSLLDYINYFRNIKKTNLFKRLIEANIELGNRLFLHNFNFSAVHCFQQLICLSQLN